MNVRLISRPTAAVTVALLTSLGVAGLGGTASATTSSKAASPDYGLFGVQDPTYDGVYRDALSLIALEAVGAPVDEVARDWIARQQCDDGAFTSYRADPTAACAATDEDSNATGLVIQAQNVIDEPTDAAVTALKRFQDADGGFYSNKLFSADPGSDANSTGIALSALASVGVDPASVVTSGHNGFDFLFLDQVGCDAAPAAQGAYDYQVESPLAPNDYATAQATLGALGKFLPVQPAAGTTTQPTLTCEPAPTAGDAQAAAGYLARRLAANDGLIPSAFGPGTDYTSTANAVIALVAAGVGSDQVTQSLDALETHVNDYVVDENGDDRPAALAELILAAYAGGRDARAFGSATTTVVKGTAHVAANNLVRRLELSERHPTAVPTPAEGGTGVPTGGTVHHSPKVHKRAEPTAALPGTGGRHLGVITLIGLGTVVAGSMLVLAGRRPSRCL